MGLRRAAPALLIVLLSLGCGNPFAWNYSGRTLSSLNGTEPWLAEPAGSSIVEPTDDFEGSMTRKLADGWVLLGTATWTGMNEGTEEQAREQAAAVGAHDVLLARVGAGYRNVGPTAERTSEGVELTYRISKGTLSVDTVTMPSPGQSCDPALPTDTTQSRLWTVKSSFWARRLHPPVFGAVTYPLPPAVSMPFAPSSGLGVLCVVRGSPAAEAGLLPRDELLELGGTAVLTDDDLMRVLRERRGTVQRLRYRRGGADTAVDVRLGD